MSTELTAEEIARKLAAPFDASEVKFKPAVVSGNRALALFYVDARVIQDRLDDVLDVTGWQDDYEVLPDGGVVCRLRLRIGGEWVTKVDVGSPSEQPDGGDRMKAAFSDALKRAAVKWGIGRYLYRVPQQWVDYDPQKKRFVRDPQLPSFARPAEAQPQKAPPKTAKPEPPPMPRDGRELMGKLAEWDAAAAQAGRCEHGDLVNAVKLWAAAAHGKEYEGDVTDWKVTPEFWESLSVKLRDFKATHPLPAK